VAELQGASGAQFKGILIQVPHPNQHQNHLSAVSAKELIASIFAAFNQLSDTSQLLASYENRLSQPSSSLSGIQLLLVSLFKVAVASAAY